MSRGRQQRFYSYNAATDEQQDRLRMIQTPVQSFFNGDSRALLETFAINTQINRRSWLPLGDATGRQGHATVDDDTIIVDTTSRRRRANEDAEFSLARSRRPRRRRVEATFADAEVRFRGMRKRFKDRWNKEFLDTPCVECATLLLLRNRKQRAF